MSLYSVFLNFTREVTSPLGLNDNELEQEVEAKTVDGFGSLIIRQVFCTPM